MNNLEETAAFLYQADDFLVVSHGKPDGDAAGSAFGMTTFLRDNGKNADVLFTDDIPDKFKVFVNFEYLRQTSDWQSGKYKTLLVTDCARSSRLNSDFKLEDFNGAIINIDHHVDNDVNGNLNIVIGEAGACCSICTNLAKLMQEKYNWHISKNTANWFYTGLVTDTGGFRFSNTNQHIFQTAAFLLDCGAEIEAVVNAAFFSKKTNQQKFEADMVLNYVKRDFDGRYVWAYLPQDLFDRYDFDMKDGEGVIEFLRETEGSVIAVLVYPKDDTLKVSLRSKDSRYPVGPVARSLNGGGHEMASGITARNISADELCAALKNKIGELLQV